MKSFPVTSGRRLPWNTTLMDGGTFIQVRPVAIAMAQSVLPKPDARHCRAP